MFVCNIPIEDLNFVNTMEPAAITNEALQENLNTQLSELDMLQSMYSKPGEIKIEDTDALNDIKQFLSGADINPPYLDITVNLIIDSSKYEICVNLPHEYPNVEPDIFVRNHKLNKTQHTLLNKDLSEYVSRFKGEICVFTAISWLQDNVSNYVGDVSEDDVDVEKSEKLVRYWIYSHHIYSKTKKREILSLANALNITGFCMAGKPGIICVEGAESDCSEWWRTIRSMTWKRIFCKVTEDCREDSDVFLKFKTFEQISFRNNSVKGNHMDMGEFYKFLELNGCSYVIKDLLGVDNKEK